MNEIELKFFETEITETIGLELKDSKFISTLSKYLKKEYKDYNLVKLKNNLVDFDGFKYILITLQKQKI